MPTTETPAPDAPPPPVPARLESPGNALRGVVSAAVLFVVVFLFVHAMLVEPFGVPTGSMAPALVGNHRETACPRCAHPVIVGEPSNGDRTPDACCPNCGQRGIDLDATWEIPGDRLLVDKNVFNARSPRRWEVAVFRCPVDLSKPYVKRMVGLPGEAIQLVGGDVFADGVLQRKTFAQLRETRIPVFDLAFAPPDTWRSRWHVGPLDGTAKPADETVLHDAALHLDATGDRPALGLTYVHWNLDRRQEMPLDDWLAYNGPPHREKRVPVHDFVFNCDLEVTAGTGSFALRLSDGLDTVRAEFPIGGADGVRLGVNADPAALQAGFALAPGRTYRLEFAFVDRRVHLAIDGVSPFPPMDLPAEPELYPRRGGVSRPVQMGIRGAAVVLRNVKLARDVHYRADGAHATKAPYRLAADEYFACGDNSANSQDSRAWTIPGVPERDFIGKPFLIHQPLKAGRVTVNGGAKTYQTVDWDRLRWVR
ncbi:MAG: hypothetical protein KF873_00220 [Gemmataceae bacterium]|nr:hypothetical protein [Gemmataceae bacterium]